MMDLFSAFSGKQLSPGKDDVYVSQTQYTKIRIKKRAIWSWTVRSPKEGEKYYALLQVEQLMVCSPMPFRIYVLG
jgi:transcription termination factor Rho